MKLIAYNPLISRRWSNWNDENNLDQSPSVNIVEKDNGFYLDVVSPGLNKDDFKIELKSNVLTISSEKKTESESNEQDKVWRKEYSFNSFTRSFHLPKTVEGDAIEATYEQGILKIFIPKKAEAVQAVKTIEIS